MNKSKEIYIESTLSSEQLKKLYTSLDKEEKEFEAFVKNTAGGLKMVIIKTTPENADYFEKMLADV